MPSSKYRGPSSKSRGPSSKTKGKKRIDPALRALIEISHAVGGDPDLVQGGGGNTSVKTADGKSMFVKASGTPLQEMDASRGWVELDCARTRAILDERELPLLPLTRREAEARRLLLASVRRPSGARPSVESCLHVLLDRVVIHTHPIGLNAMLSSKNSRTLWEKNLKGVVRAPLYVPYTDPGYTLAARLRREIDKYEATHGRKPSAVLLENHGLFVAASDVRSSLALSQKVVSAGRRWINRDRVNPRDFSYVATNGTAGELLESHEVLVRGALLRGGSAAVVVRRDTTTVARQFVGKSALIAAACRGALTPDQILYCGARPLVLRGSKARWASSVAAYRERHGWDPRVVIVKDEAVYYAASDLVELRVIAEVYRAAMATMLSVQKAGGPRFLSQSQSKFIEGCKAEESPRGNFAPLTGRVAFVTGAGSGLGKGIALGIVQAGATVFGIDIDREAVEEVAATQPRGRFLPLRCDVTDEESVRSALAAVATSVGGLDYLVNAAGIAPSFSLVDFPLAAWKKSLDINLTGYFLCAREAARLLQRQGSGGSIINLTSKSGLEASKGNSAYNATKAGEIHLMRGWAMELGRDGIRVNSVAAGNVFQGSKIWNDEYIRACAVKKGIRPEEVIPYYTSLSSLGKEIEPGDVAAAVVFLLSEDARNISGQTLVVDGGQVMVR